MNELQIGGRAVGPAHPPFVIAEIGINHEGEYDKAVRMVDDAAAAGCECVKFQSHVIEDEMIPAAGEVVPGNADESIYEIMARCALTEEEERRLKAYVEAQGMMFLSTPFSRAAAERLERLGVAAYKIGSGECNNYPLVRHIASYGKPVILSTGMNDLDSVAPSVEILHEQGAPFALLHCTSMYPTPYDKVRLGGIGALADRFPEAAAVGLSDHAMGNYACFGAVAVGASIIEKHFTSDKAWDGPDVPLSIDPAELEDLIAGTRAVHAARGGGKDILEEEQATIDFAYACVVTTAAVQEGERLTADNLWVKRPGNGEIKAEHYDALLGETAQRDLPRDAQLQWQDVGRSPEEVGETARPHE